MTTALLALTTGVVPKRPRGDLCKFHASKDGKKQHLLDPVRCWESLVHSSPRGAQSQRMAGLCHTALHILNVRLNAWAIPLPG